MQENTVIISRSDYDQLTQNELLYNALLNEDYVEIERINSYYGYSNITLVKKDEAITILKNQVDKAEKQLKGINVVVEKKRKWYKAWMK